MSIDLKKLAEPFPESDIEWRIGQAGLKDGKPWAKVLAYITNRAVQNRLDEVCGVGGWSNDWVEVKEKRALFIKGVYQGVVEEVVVGFKQTISIDIGGKVLSKTDGAPSTDIESFKGGISDAMKRAAVLWGIGRYLYDLKDNWAIITPNGEHWNNVKIKVDGQEKWINFNWNPPRLPAWATPGATQPTNSAPKPAEPKTEPPKQQQAPAAESEQHKAFDFAVRAKINQSNISGDRVDEIFLAALEKMPGPDGGIHDLQSLRWCQDQGVFGALLAVLSQEIAKTVEQSQEYKEFRSFAEDMAAKAKRDDVQIWPKGINSIMEWLIENKVFGNRQELISCRDVRKFATARAKVEQYQQQNSREEITV